jgi:ADP-ribose pyrophosphatase YjhB (NUDIX family)
MEINFCRRCGAHVTKQSDGFYVCEHGHHLFYKMYNGVLLALLNQKNEVLMIIRGRDPGKGTLDFPGGFMDLGELPMEAVRRETLEETGLTSSSYEPPQFLCWAIDTYEYQGETQEVLGACFWARVKGEVQPIAGDDAQAVKWATLNEVKDADVYSGFAAVRKTLQELRQRFNVES